MRKYLFIFLILLLVGCGKNNDKDVLKNIIKKIDNMETYNIQGELNMYNGENKYTYSVDVSFKKDDLYRVSLINKVNNHEQIILRNSEGVYVLTPSLNKSFKFQSDWPYNNSQIYILERLINDINTDEEKIYEQKDDMHIFTTRVNYSTNAELVSQKIYFDKEYNVKKVEVYNESEEILMDFEISKHDINCSIDNDLFKLNNNISNDNKTKDVSSTVENIVYPMYLPSNTYLTSQEKVKKEDGERVILSFGGDKSFTLVEETITVSKELDMNVTYGEPGVIIDTVGSIDDYSINWVSGEIEYTLLSNDLSHEELVNVAKSVSTSSITK